MRLVDVLTQYARSALSGMAITLVFGTPVPLYAWSWHPPSPPAPSYLPATGHYYQRFTANVENGESYSWGEAAAFAGSLYYQGMQGYLITITCQEEFEMINAYNELRNGGWTGAHESDGVWVWATGPEAGLPVQLFRPLFGGGGGCPNSDRILVNGNAWWRTQSSEVHDGGTVHCVGDHSIIVEFGGQAGETGLRLLDTHDPGTGSQVLLKYDAGCLPVGYWVQGILSKTSNPAMDPSAIYSSLYPTNQHIIQMDNASLNTPYYAFVRFVDQTGQLVGPPVPAPTQVRPTIPTFFVHGLGSDSTIWDPLVADLGAVGQQYLFQVSNLQPWGVQGERHFNGNALLLGAYIKIKQAADHQATLAFTGGELAELSPWREINLVGHSMGGLISRRYLAGRDYWAAQMSGIGVARLVMLGTPNMGVRAADNACLVRSVLLDEKPALCELSEYNMVDFNRRFSETGMTRLYFVAGTGGTVPVESCDGGVRPSHNCQSLLLRAGTYVENCPNDGIVSQSSAFGGGFTQPSYGDLIVPLCHFNLYGSTTVRSWIRDVLASDAIQQLARVSGDALTQQQFSAASELKTWSAPSADQAGGTFNWSGGSLSLSFYVPSPEYEASIVNPLGVRFSLSDSPGGVVTTSRDALGVTGVIGSASAGTWSWEVTPPAQAASESLYVFAHGSSQTSVEWCAIPSELIPGASFIVCSKLMRSGAPVLSAVVSAMVEHRIDGVVQSVYTHQLYDDGTNGDNFPGDGIYGRSESAPAAGTLAITGRAEFEENAVPSSRTWHAYSLVEDATLTGIGDVLRETPRMRDALSQNQPNPFNPVTTIGFDVAQANIVHLRIFDVGGRFVTDLIGKWLPAGSHRIQWAGLDRNGKPVASGVYSYRLEVGGKALARRMVLLK